MSKKKKTILIVESEEDSREQLRALLEKSEYSVITAISSAECIQKSKEHNVDLVLLDVLTVGWTLKNVVETLKDNKIAFCSLMKFKDEERVELSSQKNIVGFIQKPFELSTVTTTISKILQ